MFNFGVNIPDIPAANIAAVFGEKTVLLPIAVGAASPTDAKWHTITTDTASTPDYQRKLAVSSIAVLCGVKSSCLAAFQFGDTDQADKFLADNPDLKSTLMTSTPDGLFVWVRFLKTGAIPADLDQYRILADGNCVKIFDRIDPGKKYLVRNAPISTAEFKHLVLRGCNALALRMIQYACNFGNPVIRGKINPIFWSITYAEEMGVCFDVVNEHFFEARAGKRRLVAETLLKKEILDWAAVCEKAYPDLSIRSRMGPKELNEIVAMLKVHAAREEPGEESVLHIFLKEQVEARPGATTTTEELRRGSEMYCANKERIAMPEQAFYRQLEAPVEKIFGVKKSNDVKRGTDEIHRGFRNLNLKKISICQPEATDARTASDVSFGKHAA
jgi:hypothetical protein